MFFRKPSAPAGDRRPASAPPFEYKRGNLRCMVESAAEMRLSGWAATPGPLAAEITASCAGRALATTTERVARADVLAHLGAPADGPPLGFTLALPPQVWEHAAADGSVDIRLQLNGDAGEMPGVHLTRALLHDWLERLLGLADAAQGRQAWAQAEPHLRQGLTAPDWERARQRWLAVEAEHRARQLRPGARLAWSIEHNDGLRILGWAADPSGGDDDFRLSCDGRPLPVGLVRFERADVQAQLTLTADHDLPGQVRLDSGFELELPASLWQLVAPDRSGSIQLQLGDRPLLAPPLQLSRATLAQAVAAARSAAAAAGPADDPAEAHYRSLLLLEHASAAGIVSQLPADDAAWLRALATRQGVDLPEASTPGPAQAPAPADAQHLFNQALWRLQRRFNAALADHAKPSGHALLAALPPPQDSAETTAHARFLVSMVPFFCAADALPALRPRLDDAELQTLIHAQGRWELSLLLPVALLDELDAATGRLERTVALMERLAATPDAGWLNSAAVLDTFRRLARALDDDPLLDDGDLDRIVAAGLRLLDTLGDGLDARSYDEDLVDAACQLLRLAAHAGESSLQLAADGVLKHHGLNPRFWRQLPEPGPGPGLSAATPWPVSLQRGRRYAEHLFALWPALSRGDATVGPACGAALRGLRELGCADVDAVQRQALLALAPTTDPGALREAARGLRGLPAADALRWLGRQPDSLSALAPMQDPASVLRLAAPSPPVPTIVQRRLALQALDALRHAVATIGATTSTAPSAAEADAAQAGLAAQRACLALAGERDDFIGLAWLASAAGLCSRSRTTATSAALVDGLRRAVRHAVAATERNRERHPVPPASLVAALGWLRRLAEQAPPPGLATLLADAEQRLRTLWQADAEAAAARLPATPALATGTPAVGTLVLVRWREGVEAARLAQIGSGWGARLDDQGIAWALWQQRPGATGLRAGAAGPPQLQAASLFDLLDWLLAHSDFGHLLLLEDDAELDVERWQQAGAGAHHYHGLPAAAPSVTASEPWDKSPSGTRFAVAADGLGLSRYAVQRALALRGSARGARLGRGSSSDEKWLGDLLALVNIPLCEQGQAVHQGRPPQPGFQPAAYLNLYAPAPGMPTVLSHAAADAPACPAAAPFRPRRLWPADTTPRLAHDGSGLQMVELSAPRKADALVDADCLVVAVARNEITLLPHFLAHYRQLGARHFVVVDNLSDDGSRDYLLAQDDVVLYSADTSYRQARYGVTWQQAVLAAHGLGRWAVLADIDEFLVWPGCETDTLPALCRRLQDQGADAARMLMIDMYPEGPLEQADFAATPPFQAAPCFDAQAALPWRLGSGSYSNSPSWVSGLRHRLLPGSAPNHYTSQKVALMRHQPWVRCSEGLHYAAGLDVSNDPLAFAHFKYHRGFQAKVLAEVARKQHYNGAEEYRQYLGLLSQARGSFFDPKLSHRYENSQSFAPLLS